MANRSQRVKDMIEGFMHLHSEGKSIAEIANYFNLSTRTIYQYLEVIAKKNNVTRESLLKTMHKPHEMKSVRNYNPKEKTNLDEMRKDFSDMINSADNIIYQIENILNKEEI